MAAKERKKSAMIRVFNIVLNYDTEKKDNELEKYSVEFLEQINLVLLRNFPRELPQLTIDATSKKALKIGIRPHDEEDELL